MWAPIIICYFPEAPISKVRRWCRCPERTGQPVLCVSAAVTCSGLRAITERNFYRISARLPPFASRTQSTARACCVRGSLIFSPGWHNRRYLQQRLKEELARAQRRGGSIACLMIDIDKFKSINDGYGHLAGDNALKEIAHRVEAQIRSMDTAARFGGDELAILLPEATAEEAAKLADRIRERIAAVPVSLNSQITRHLTISVGVAAVSPGRHETDLKAVADRLVAEADAALYRAKALGRNRVQVGVAG